MKHLFYPRLFFCVLFWNCLCSSSIAVAQPAFCKENPKIGLCLSGGGARGLAHIALLKAIDSLGIHIDYIAGTSMGGIIGGLYAIGYSGNQLDSIARNTDWGRLFEVKTPYDEIRPDEKDEYGHYMIELPWRREKFELPSGLIEGQALLNKLELLTAAVADVDNFDHFRIPFRCIAANISDGVPIVFDHGNLAMALRTTMSIPGFFAPIIMGDDKILVDGGVFKNFPVDILCDMGADFVVGGYCSLSLVRGEDLHSMSKIMVQSTSFGRIAESENQRQSCSIYADISEELNIDAVTPGDFKSVNTILAAGDRAVNKVLPQLAALAQEQQAQKEVIPAGNTQLIKPASSDIAPWPPMKIYSNNNARIVLKAGVHYDNEMDAGLIGNLTLRNVFGAQSRSLLSAEFAENYKIRAEHRIAIKSTKNDLIARTYFERVTAPVYFSNLSYDNFKRRYFRFQAGVQRNLNKTTLTGTYLTYEQIGYKPDVRLSRRNQTSSAIDTLTGTVKANAQLPGVEFILIRQNLDQPIFATSGSRFSVQARFSFATRVRYLNERISDGNITSYEDIQAWAKPYTKVLIRWEQVYPMGDHVSVFPRIATGFRLTNGRQEDQLGVLDRFNVGGVDWRNDWAFVPFAGNKEAFTFHSAFASMQLGVPLNFKKKYFLIPQYAIVMGTGVSPIEGTPLLNITNTMQQSFGVMVGMQTILGPIYINMAKADNDRALHFYGSIGLRF